MSKRVNGEGSIHQRKDGRWCASISTGRGKRKRFLAHSRAQVAQELTAALKDRDDDLPAIREHPTVAAYLASWLEAVRPTVRERTYDRYEQYVRLHAVPALGTIRLSKLSPQHLQRLCADRLSAGASPTTVHHLHTAMHKALDQALKWNLVPCNVADLVEPPRPARFEMNTLSADEARRLLDAAAAHRLEALFVLALTTGMRQGELLGLRWCDVDLGGAALHIRGSMQATRAGLRLAEPKTPGSRRQVLVTRQAVAALRQHRARQAAERLHVGVAWQDNDLVFANEVGRPIAAGNLLRRAFEPLLKRAGLPKMRFHDLRHSAATLLLAQGVHAKIVSEMLGHARISTTLDLYSHVTPTMQRQATVAMEALLSYTSQP